MSPRARKENARFVEVPGYPDLELDTRSGVYYVRKFISGKGELFKSTRERTRRRAQTVAEGMMQEFRGRKAGLRNERLKIAELCDLVLKDLEEQTRTLDESGHPIRRLSTFRDKDLPYLRGRDAKVKRRKGMREQGVIRDLFGDAYADEIDEQFWKTWVKKTGRKMGRKLGDVAKYLSLVLTFAFEEKYLVRKPRIKSPDKHVRKAQVYSDQLILKLFQKAEPTLQDLIVIGSENPLRPHENCEVRWEMVTIGRDSAGALKVVYDLPEWFVKRNARKIRLTPNAAAVVERRWKERQGLPPSQRSPFVFPAPKDPQKPLSKKTRNRMWHRLLAALGVTEPIQFEWFRHNVYRRLTKVHGLSLAQVSQVGGTSAATLRKHYDLEEEVAIENVAGAISLPFGQPPQEEEE